MITLLLAVAIQASPAPSPKPVFLPESYAHPFYAYKIYLPARWTKGETKGKVQNSFYGPKDGIFTPRMDMTIQKSTADLDKTAEAYQQAFQKEFKDMKFTRYEGIEGRCGAGKLFVAEFKDGPVEMCAMWSFFKAEGRMFAMGFSVTKNWADRYFPAVEASMKSLRIFPEPTEPKEQQQEMSKAYTEGEVAVHAGKYEDALKPFKKAAELMPTFSEVHGAIAICYMKLKNYKSAEPELRKAIELDPDDYRYHFDLGVCLLVLENYKGAVEQLEKAAQLDANSEPAFTNLGVAYLGLDKDADAARVLEKAVRADPESVAAHYNLGTAYEHLKKNKEALSEYKETLKLDAKHKGAAEALKRLKP